MPPDFDRLPDDCRRILDALVDGPVAWLPFGALASRSGVREPGRFFAALAELESAGWACTWAEMPAGQSATLTPWGAERLGVRVVEAGEGAIPRWAGPGRDEPPARVPRFDPGIPGVGVTVDRRLAEWEAAVAREVEALLRLKGCSGAWGEAREAALSAAGRSAEARRRKRARERAARALRRARAAAERVRARLRRGSP